MPIELGRKVIGIDLVLACYDLQSILDLLNRHSCIVLYAYSLRYKACKMTQWMNILEVACRTPVLKIIFWWISRGAREKLHSGMGVLQSICGRSYGIWNIIMEMSGVYKKIPNSVKAFYIKEFLDFHRQP